MYIPVRFCPFCFPRDGPERRRILKVWSKWPKVYGWYKCETCGTFINSNQYEEGDMLW